MACVVSLQIGEDEYMAFGISGSDTNSSMLGADVAVVRFSSVEQRGFATDYNITALAPVRNAHHTHTTHTLTTTTSLLHFYNSTFRNALYRLIFHQLINSPQL